MKFSYKNRFNRIIFLLCLLLIFSQSAYQLYSQGGNKMSSFEGRNFYVAFMQNEITYTTREQEPNALEIFISSSRNANVNVNFQGNSRDIHIAANTMGKVIFGREVVQTRSEIVLNMSIHITSDVPITIYGINSIPASSDMFSAIPTMNWGKEYVIMSFPNDTYKDPNESEPSVPRKSQFCVIASEDNTTVRIIPAAVTAENRPAGSPFTVILNKGQTYLVQSSDVRDGGDLTGSNVSADKPIGVFSGHVRTAILQNLSILYDTKDHLVEMMTPINSWGTNFVTIPFLLANNKEDGNLYRVIAKNPGTNLTIRRANGDTSHYTLGDKFSFLEIPLLSYPAVWSSSGPIQIMQYMKHTGYADNANFDPSMTLVPPVEQYVQKILIQTPDNSSIIQVSNQYETHRASIVMEKQALPTFQFDGMYLQDIFNLNVTEIPGTNYYWIRIPVGTGSHLFTSSTGRFSGILYGYGKNDSYSVIMGSSLLPLEMVDNKAPIVKVDSLCGKLTGYVYESKDTTVNSGIDFIYVNTENTKNYNCTIGQISDTSTYVSIDANVIDDRIEGYLEIKGQDRAGNEFTFNYTFYPLIASYSNGNITNDIVDWKSTKCYDTLWVENKSKIPFTIYSITSNSPKVTVIPSATLPYIILPGEKFKYQICASPNGDLNEINSFITLQYNCNKTYTFNWKLKVNACEFLADDMLDFGDVYLNNDKRESITFRNDGVEDIIVTGLQNLSPITGAFDYESYNTFPITIKSGNSVKFDIGFNPKNNQNYTENYQILYNCESPRYLTLKGKGISSELNDLSYDFGKVRTTTTATHTLVLTNNGNIPAPIKFSTIIEDNPDFIFENDLYYLNTTIPPGESFNINVRFVPSSIGKKHFKANFSLELDRIYIHSIELFGEVVAPTISAGNHNLGNLIVFDVKDTIVKIAENIGNYDLNIKSISVDSGDVSQFIFDLSPFQNKILSVNDSILLPIRYKPVTVDTHVVKFKINHDELYPNDNFVNTFFYIGGSARARDTIAINHSLEVVENPDNCNENIIIAKLTNKGNIISKITAIDVIGESTFNGAFEDFPNVPMDLLPYSTIEFKYRFINSKATAGKMIIILKFENYPDYQIVYDYTPPNNTKNLILVKNDNINFIPGDTISLTLQGRFPHNTDLPINSYLRIKTNPQVIRLLSGEYNLEIINNSNLIEKKLDLLQKFDYFDIPIIVSEKIDGNDVHWNISLDFITYFKKERYNPISISFNSDDCFNSVIDSILTEMTEVCLHSLRDIGLITTPELKVFFNNSNNTLDISFMNHISDQKLNIKIYDLNGRLINEFNNVINEFGQIKINLDLSEIPNGVYLYKITGLFINENNKFIK